MLFNPSENFDGHVRAIPFVYPRNGQDITDAPIFTDDPKLTANGNSRTGSARVDHVAHADAAAAHQRDMLRRSSRMTSLRGTTITATPRVTNRRALRRRRRVPLRRRRVRTSRLVPVQTSGAPSTRSS
jgi:hypothetical protein